MEITCECGYKIKYERKDIQNAHYLMCGDATKKEDVERLMDGKRVDMIFTDPPYGINLDTDYSVLNSKLKFIKEKNLRAKSGNKYERVIGDEKPFDYRLFEWVGCEEQFWWGGDYYVETIPNFGKEGSWIVWDKRDNSEQFDKMYGSCFELCWSKAKHKREIVRVRWAGVFGIEQEFDRKRHHPTQKPIELCGWFIKRYSKPNWVILDFFGGSGSTLIACEQTNRICYMMEIDPKYCDVIRKRYANFIGKNDQWETIIPKI